LHGCDLTFFHAPVRRGSPLGLIILLFSEYWNVVLRGLDICSLSCSAH